MAAWRLVQVGSPVYPCPNPQLHPCCTVRAASQDTSPGPSLLAISFRTHFVQSSWRKPAHNLEKLT